MTVPKLSADIVSSANELLRKLSQRYDRVYGYGTMSCTIYDTAWVSMVLVPGRTEYLFPECFEYVLRRQSLSDGSFEGYASDLDSLLNTLAALLAMKKHWDLAEQRQEETKAEGLNTRIELAKKFVTSKLDSFDFEATIHVGFEVIVPALLRYLAAEGITFEFRGRDRLEYMEQKKLGKFDTKLLETSGKKLSALHSLEAFIGKVDFDCFATQKTFGSIMASPAATAAYLLNTSQWDVEAEEYLRFVVSRNLEAHSGCAGVPSAFPSTFFEYTWVS